MELLKGRPLALICVLSIFIMYLSSYASDKSFGVSLTVTLAVIASAVTVIRWLRKRSRRKRINLFRVAVCIAIFISLSLTLSDRAFEFYNVKYASVRDSMDKDCTVVGEITEVGYRNDWGERLYARLMEIDGNSVDAKAVIEIDGETGLEVGNVFALIGTPTDFTEEESYLVSDGNAVKIVCENAINVQAIGYSEHKVLFWFKELNTKFQRSIYHSTDEDSGALIGALVLGNRDQLSDSVIRDFRRCGISHVIALSGMHMAIIIGGFDFGLQKFRVGRKIRCFVLAFLALCYLALTGFSVSACRAVIMIFMVYIGHLIWRDSDPITSLAIATTVILGIDPYALGDVSLWMSVIATLGIIVVSEIISPLGYKIKKKPINVQLAYKLLSSVSLTLAAIFFVSVFNWLCFGEISIIAPLTNLIVTPIITCILILGVFTVLCSPVYPIARLIGSISGFLCKIALGITKNISNMRNITVSLEYDFVKYVAVPFIVALVLFLILRIKHKWTIALIPTAAVVAFVVLFNIHLANNRGITQVTYVQSDTSEMLVITNNESTTICDISTGGYRHLAKAFLIADKSCSTEIESIILTHYHNYHAPTLLRICDKYTVRNILLPEPETADEEDIFNNIKTAFKNKYTVVSTYRRGYAHNAGEGCSVNISRQHYIKRSTHPMFMISVKLSEKSDADELLYFSSPIFEDPYADYPGDPDCVIVGKHGPKIHRAPSIYIIERSLPNVVLLTDGEKMLSNDETIGRLENLRDNFGVKVIFDNDEFNFILN